MGNVGILDGGPYFLFQVLTLFLVNTNVNQYQKNFVLNQYVNMLFSHSYHLLLCYYFLNQTLKTNFPHRWPQQTSKGAGGCPKSI